jgi:hypothetical protein
MKNEPSGLLEYLLAITEVSLLLSAINFLFAFEQMVTTFLVLIFVNGLRKT